VKKPFLGADDVIAEVPSIVMYDPRDSHNVGAAVRACSCFGVKQVWLTGRRTAEQVWKAKRIPREERMKGFSDVQIVLEDRPFGYFPKGTTPVAVELLKGSENMLGFEHPENPVYIFGPEDGSIPGSVRRLCHRRLFIPTRHCVNLSSAVYLVLYDRLMKSYMNGDASLLPMEKVLHEDRGGWPGDDLPEFGMR
jgi:tRNA(Leu) C34 or U34 (ribose-2'-O)-methylase TrmL